MTGFAGVRVRPIASYAEGAHVLTIALYRFADGTESTYVEAHETHDDAGPARLLPLSAVVHLVQNATDAERWAIENRIAPPCATCGKATVRSIMRAGIPTTSRMEAA